MQGHHGVRSFPPHQAQASPNGQGANRPQDQKKLFQPKAFPWGKAASAPPEPKPKAKAEGEPTTRIYEVIQKTTTVRAEPHLGAKMKTKKSKGARVRSCEVTMNGWLKLEGEPGYMVTNMRSVEGIEEVTKVIDEDGAVAIPDYQPLGICCLEVVYKTGAPVFEAPNRDAALLTTRRLGEYVFAQSQNFDGWISLASPDAGWMQLRCPKAGELLRLRRTRDVDIWALSDCWATSRKTRQASFGTREVQSLKDLERRVMHTMSGHLAEVQESGSVDKIIAEGLLTMEDLEDAASRVRCKLFGNILVKMVKEDAMFRDLMPNFALSAHPPPLPATEQEEEEAQMYDDGGWHGGDGGQGGYFDPDAGKGGGLSAAELRNTQPFICGDRVFRMAPNGILYDPPNEVPIGLWNAKTQQIEPAAGTMPGCPYAMLSYFGKNYVVMPDNAVIDPTTEEVVGVLNQETNQIDEIEPVHVSKLESSKENGGKGAGGVSSMGGPPLSESEAQQLMSESMEQGENMVEVGAFEEAALSFSKALDACRRSRTSDVEVECDILRMRAACWARTGSYTELLQDAERILEYSADDAEAEEWRKMASFELIRNMKPETKPSGKGGSKGYDAPWKDQGGMSSSSRPGAGSGDEKRCAYCNVQVDKPSICSKCRTTVYCGRACQRNHWKVHKHECGKPKGFFQNPSASSALDDDDGAGMEELD